MPTIPIPTLTGILANIEAILETQENYRERRAAIRDTKALIESEAQR